MTYDLSEQIVISSSGKVIFNTMICAESLVYGLAVGKLYKFDNCFEVIDEKNVNQMFNKITFDSKEQCFWATARNDSLVVYKLNLNFFELDRVYLNVAPFINNFNTKNLYHDFFTDLLYICGRDYIIAFNKLGEMVDIIRYPQKGYCPLAVCTSEKHIYIAYSHEYQCFIHKYTKDGAIVYRCPILNSITNIQFTILDCQPGVAIFGNKKYSYNFYQTLK